MMLSYVRQKASILLLFLMLGLSRKTLRLLGKRRRKDRVNLMKLRQARRVAILVGSRTVRKKGRGVPNYE